MLRNTEVDLTGLMRVLGEALYSTPQVAIRELVQNAHDSLERRRLEHTLPEQPTIRISTDAARGQLSIEDNGAGLTADEIQKYLATVGAGYTRTLRDRDASSSLIGYFGLGFLSAFVVAERTEVWTCSYQAQSEAWLFTSRSGETYSVQPAEARPIGTRVTLYLRDSFRELASSTRLAAVVSRYCRLLSLPVEVDGVVVNADPPPWRSSPDTSPARKKKRALELATSVEKQFAPITTLELVSSESGPTVNGMLWIQDGGTYGTSDNRTVSVYVRGMLVSDDERELLPSWAGFVGAVIESDALKPTASRESLQKDDTFEYAKGLLRESLVRGLASLASAEPANWRRVLRRHNEALLGAAIADERLFQLLARQLTVPTSVGDLTVPAVLERSRGAIHVRDVDTSAHHELLFRALNVPVVDGTRYGAHSFSRLYTERVGGKLVMLGTEKGERELFREATVSESERERIQQFFGAPDRQLFFSRFAPSYLPFVAVKDREAELKRKIEAEDADQRMGQAILSLARQFTTTIGGSALLRFHVNMDCPVIAALLRAPPERANLALRLMSPLGVLVGEAAHGGETEASLQSFCSAMCTVLEETK
ncbi:MAG TPA: ATP-binding protein [Polyangiaceae bacterium]|nr:ATP-binding protein [Polyangiaceae bacterium]